MKATAQQLDGLIDLLVDAVMRELICDSDNGVAPVQSESAETVAAEWAQASERP